MIRFDITKRFDLACKILVEKRLIPLPEGMSAEEILRCLQGHERRYICLDNICGQVQAFEKSFKKNRQDAKRVNQIIAAAAQLYCLAVLEHRRQQSLSHAEQKRLESEGSLHRELASLVKESTGVKVWPGPQGQAPASKEAGT